MGGSEVIWRCFQWLKVTKMKANHNTYTCNTCIVRAVSNGSKLLKWKQITTLLLGTKRTTCCFQWLKVTKMKANHNTLTNRRTRSQAVSNGSKLLKWKQITTCVLISISLRRCFQWLKVTQMKANHNCWLRWQGKSMLFPMAQSY